MENASSLEKLKELEEIARKVDRIGKQLSGSVKEKLSSMFETTNVLDVLAIGIGGAAGTALAAITASAAKTLANGNKMVEGGALILAGGVYGVGALYYTSKKGLEKPVDKFVVTTTSTASVLSISNGVIAFFRKEEKKQEQVKEKKKEGKGKGGA